MALMTVSSNRPPRIPNATEALFRIAACDWPSKLEKQLLGATFESHEVSDAYDKRVRDPLDSSGWTDRGSSPGRPAQRPRRREANLADAPLRAYPSRLKTAVFSRVKAAYWDRL
jgi:hypothetical protein